MRRRGVNPVLGLVVAFVFASSASSAAAQAVLVADTHVSAALPAANSGGISNVNVGGGYTGLLQFDLSLLPQGTTATQISRAVLMLYLNRLDTPGTISLQPLSASWSELSVTYQTLPSSGAPVATFALSQADGFVAVDVTGLVEGWLAAPATNFGISLTSGDAVAAFDSKENDLTGHPATLAVSLTSQGVVGPAGPAGPQGAAGPQGLTGPQGAQGLTGPAGAVGLTGPSGVTGLQGPAGPAGAAGPIGNAGPAGPAGPAGNAGPAGPAGAAGAAGPTGPMGLAGAAGAQGPRGADGVAGVAGPPGAAGPAGPAGATGPAGAAGPAGLPGTIGPAGVTFRGSYASGLNYGIGDAVSFAGSSYLSLLGSNIGNLPGNVPAAWGLLALAGSVGPAGPSGASGTPGAPGPQGPGGVPGAAGQPGDPGINFRGAWGSGPSYAVHDAVTFGGAAYLATYPNSSAQPDQNPSVWALLAAAGSAGPSGVAGPAATVQVGSVVTGQPGSTAAVVNVGTPNAAVLNFTIPQGAMGAPGSGGMIAGAGSSFGSVVHNVSYTTVYYSVLNANQGGTEDAPELTWVPNGCTASQLSVYSLQAETITVTVRAGTPSAMADTPLSCQASTGSSCTATGGVVVPAGGFLDFSITHSGATPAGVWTALTCQ